LPPSFNAKAASTDAKVYDEGTFLEPVSQPNVSLGGENCFR
jgi:hypothetical protein